MNTLKMTLEDYQSEALRFRKLIGLLISLMPAVFFSIFKLLNWHGRELFAIFRRPAYLVEDLEDDFFQDNIIKAYLEYRK